MYLSILLYWICLSSDVRMMYDALNRHGIAKDSILRIYMETEYFTPKIEDIMKSEYKKSMVVI